MITLAAALALSLVSPPPSSAALLDRYFSGLISKKKCPSVSVAIVKNGKVAYARAFGEADIENGVKATNDSVYRIGSLTKQFTATMIMQLVGEGKLALDAKLADLLPGLPTSWARITVRQLLSHTSGIKNYTDVKGLFEGPAMKPTSPLGILRTVWDDPLDFAPGSSWKYSNTGYVVLGMVIEKLDGKPYAKSLSDRILAPLGMNRTFFTSERTIVKGRAHGYSAADGGFLNARYVNMDWPYAAGSIESTSMDLAKWDAALFGERILPQSALRQMWTPVVTPDGKPRNYGFGWLVDRMNGYEFQEHGGGIPGYTRYIRRVPALGDTVIVLCNGDGVDVQRVGIDALAIYDRRLKEPEPKSVKDTDPAATAFARKVYDSLAAGTLDHSLLTPELDKLVTEQAGAAKHLFESLGAIKGFALADEVKTSGLTTRTYAVSYADTTLRFVMSIDVKGKIVGLGIQ